MIAMIEINFLFALISFYFVMYVTPGPNNAMVLVSGLKFGFSKTIVVILGITIGHIVQLVLVCLGLGRVFQMVPEIQIILKTFCSAYMVYLSYKIIGSFSTIEARDKKPIKFHEAALFQLINPKAWTISSMAASGFLLNERDIITSIVILVFVALIVCPISIFPWAVFGSAVKVVIKNVIIKTLIEYLLASLLFISAVLIVIDY